jgi:hypothetical protein
VSDEFTVRLCPIHHRELHCQVNEEAWWLSSTSMRRQLRSHSGSTRAAFSYRRLSLMKVRKSGVPLEEGVRCHHDFLAPIRSKPTQLHAPHRPRFLLSEVLPPNMCLHIHVPKKARPLLQILAMTALTLPMIPAGASQTEPSSPWIVPARLTRNGEADGSAINLNSGLIITAAHLTSADANMGVLMAGGAFPATVVKQGKFEDVDLTPLSVDPQKLPARVVRIQTPLCEAPGSPGDPVLVVNYDSAARSHIISPQTLPGIQSKFHTLVAARPQGRSGSGVFEPNHKCLHGIMSRALLRDGKEIATYFLPADETSSRRSSGGRCR